MEPERSEKSASEETTGTTRTTVVVSKKSRKGLWVALLVLILALAAGVWVWARQDTKTSTNNTSTSTAPTTNQSNSEALDTLAYTFSESSDAAPHFYWRPATGGDRHEAGTLNKGDFPSFNKDTRGQHVAMEIKGIIWLSTDGGRSYKKLYSLTQPRTGEGDIGEQITSLRFANDGNSLVIGFLPATGNNTVKMLDLQGHSKDLFTSSKRGVFLYAWDSVAQKVIYSEGCYNCDLAPPAPIVLRDVKNGTVTELAKPDDTTTISSQAAVSTTNLSTLVYVRATKNTGIGEDVVDGPPYMIERVDLSSNKTTTLATIGTKEEKDSSGQFKFYDIKVGVVNGSTTPYYTVDNKLYVMHGSTPSLALEADQTIQHIYFVDSDTIIGSSGKTSSDFTVFNYGLKDKKSITILSGNSSTGIAGVTTK